MASDEVETAGHGGQVPVIEPLADDVAQASRNIGISRSMGYQEIRAGRLDSFTVGKRRLVSRKGQKRFIREREAEERAARELAASQGTPGPLSHSAA